MQDQYRQLKKDNPNTILLFKTNEHYHAFYSDAVKLKDCNAYSIIKGGVLQAQTSATDLSFYVNKLKSKGYSVSIVKGDQIHHTR